MKEARAENLRARTKALGAGKLSPKDMTALMKNARYISSTQKIPESEAIDRLTQGKPPSPEQMYKEVYGASKRAFASNEESAKAASDAVDSYLQMRAKSVPFTQDGKVDRSRMRRGDYYKSPEGNVFKWNGKDFEKIPPYDLEVQGKKIK